MRHKLVESTRRGIVWGIVASLHAGALLLLIRPGMHSASIEQDGRTKPIQVRLITKPRRSDTAASRSTPIAPPTGSRAGPRAAAAQTHDTLSLHAPEAPANAPAPDFRQPMLGQLDAVPARPRVPGQADPIIAGFHFEPVPPSFAKHVVQVIAGMAGCGNIAVARNMSPYERAMRGITDQELDRAADALGCR